METNDRQVTANVLVTGRGASRICRVSHPTFHKWVREGKVSPLGWIETERGAPIPVFTRSYIEAIAEQKQVA
jgi:hypothetical protein